MRRWTGTRWVSYGRDEKQPDVGPLLDFESEAPEVQVQFGCAVDGRVAVSHVTVAGATTLHLIPPVAE